VALGREVVDFLLCVVVSLVPSIWYHRLARADEWLLFEQVSPIAAAGRAFTRTEVFSAAGELVASIAQEGLVFDPVEETGVGRT
jgi:acyl-CoA thioesterase II